MIWNFKDKKKPLQFFRSQPFFSISNAYLSSRFRMLTHTNFAFIIMPKLSDDKVKIISEATDLLLSIDTDHIIFLRYKHCRPKPLTAFLIGRDLVIPQDIRKHKLFKLKLQEAAKKVIMPEVSFHWSMSFVADVSRCSF